MSGEIQLIAETKEYRIYGRENCVAVVHFTQSGDAAIGSSGIMTENGLAYLVWRGEKPLLMGKGVELDAAPEQVDTLRRFSEDLKNLIQPRMDTDPHG